MNKRTETIVKAEEKRKFFNGKIKDFLLLAGLALVLTITAWRIFGDDGEKASVSAQATETETKVMRLIEEIDGVGEASVIVYEDEDGVKSVVVVCEGANDLRVVMDVREAVSAALGTEQKAVKIYLKKE